LPSAVVASSSDTGTASSESLVVVSGVSVGLSVVVGVVVVVAGAGVVVDGVVVVVFGVVVVVVGVGVGVGAGGGVGFTTVYDAPDFVPRISWLVVLLATVEPPVKVMFAVPVLLRTAKFTLATSRLLPLTALMLPRAILTDPPPPDDDASIAKALPDASMLWNCSRLVEYVKSD
jgi:hypothetical protein